MQQVTVVGGVCWTAFGVTQRSVGFCMHAATVLECSNGDQVTKDIFIYMYNILIINNKK